MGALLFIVLSTIIGGLLIGGLGRLVVPGPNPIGFWATVLCGVGGAIGGSLVAAAIFANPGAHWLLTLALEVIVAAALVTFVSRRRRGHWA